MQAEQLRLKLSFDEGVDLGLALGTREDSVYWEWGDLILRLEADGAINTGYGRHGLADFAKRVNREPETLTQYRHVADVFRICDRSQILSWAHHLRLAGREDRLDWLKKAEANGWSVRDMLYTHPALSGVL